MSDTKNASPGTVIELKNAKSRLLQKSENKPEDNVTQSVSDASDTRLAAIYLAPTSLISGASRDLNPNNPNEARAVLIKHLSRKSLQLLAKRLVDILGSGLGMLLLLPLFAIVALAVKLTSKGPIFFAQARVGKDGRLFKMYKFRSMRADAEAHKALLQAKNEASGPVFKIENDPRMTKVGSFLRKFSLDELPQFWNVFTGDMSVVGPRPPIPTEVAQYTEWERLRLSVKPGLTCIWQVSGRSKIAFPQWVAMDIEYIRSWSLILDLKILLRTFSAVLRGDGAW